jgi:rod shape-determining protein MreD
MSFSKHLIILSSIIFGFWLETIINEFSIPYFIEINLGFLIFTYWVFALPEQLKSMAAIVYGLFIDLIFSDAIGFNMLFFTGTSYVIHLYVLRFRIFSYFQLSIFFAGSSIFYLSSRYLLLSPMNYSYFLLLASFFINAILWLGVYFIMRAFRRNVF